MKTATADKITISYARFRGIVDAQLNNICGIGVDELPDFDLWNYYNENEFMTKEQWYSLANEAARDLLSEEGFDFDDDGVQTNVYKTYTKNLKNEDNKLLNKKLIILNNVISDHENLVKVVDKEYEADISQDEYVVVG